MSMNVIGLVGWAGGWVLLLGISTRTPNWAVWIFMPYFVYGFYRTLVQLRCLPTALRTLQVLQHYPWQLLPNAPRALDEHPDAEVGEMWIELPDPSSRGKRGIPLTFVKHFRAYWWLRHIGGPRTRPELKAMLEPLWFAGDPRFLGVVAVNGRRGAPRRLHFLYQPSALDARAARREWDGITPEDIERARRAGARFLPSAVAVTPARQEP
ncbi:hypothetical protein STRCI_005211 [Streptomyces cinnabarinus]|uniref:Uncharacterized protein n=1 Tax=Streptomyces cinnabarinus TaxID=67287 RepID=A0ABY7KLM7_9ACTN|nr:hypothetical protein [Streptomyces cinnabarinus]WAZ23841.1 hypothetical protein STRCI_005211 [Streptomyces cinnabarinus]